MSGPTSAPMPERVHAAAIATIVSGVVLLAGGVLAMVVLSVMAFMFTAAGAGAHMGSMTMWPMLLFPLLVLVFAIGGIVVGAITLWAGLRLKRGDRQARGLATGANIAAIVVAAPGMGAAGAGLAAIAASAIALWALSQPEARAWFET